MALSLEQRLDRIRVRLDELTWWRERETVPVGGWTLNGKPIEIGAPWPSRDGVQSFAAGVSVPASWPIAETRLFLDLGGEALATLIYADDNVGFGRRGRFGFSQQSALVDMDGDGDLDIVHGESDFFDGAQIQWTENVDGKGGNWRARPLPLPEDSTGDFHSVAAHDFDGDGDIDLFAAESEWLANRARWFLWENLDGKGGRFERHLILEGLGAHNAVAADMDGDGDIDIVNKEFAPARWNRLEGGQHADLLENRSRPRP